VSQKYHLGLISPGSSKLRLGLYFLSRRSQLERWHLFPFSPRFNPNPPPRIRGEATLCKCRRTFRPSHASLIIILSNRHNAELSNVWRRGLWCGASGDARLDKTLSIALLCRQRIRLREPHHCEFTMATTLARPWTLSDTPTANLVVESIQTASLDDVVAMAMLAILSAVYLVRGTLWDRPDPHLYKMYERPQEQMGSNSVAPVSRDVSERMQQMVRLKSAVIFAAALTQHQGRRHCHLLGLSVRHCRTFCWPIG
jgi:hypothetical protein